MMIFSRSHFIFIKVGSAKIPETSLFDVLLAGTPANYWQKNRNSQLGLSYTFSKLIKGLIFIAKCSRFVRKETPDRLVEDHSKSKGCIC